MRIAPYLRRAAAGIRLSTARGQHRWLLSYLRWRRAALSPAVITVPGDTTGILLSYKRPQNIDVLIRVLLRTPSIGRVIVSNNNPDVRIRDWVSVGDPRVRFIDQPQHRHSHIRYALAREDTSSLFFCIDDDLFLRSSQIEKLLRELRSDGSAPHGIFGQVHDSWQGRMQSAIRGVHYRCSCLNRAYAFNRAHIVEFDRLCPLLGFTPASPYWESGMWDDFVLSFSGTKMPMLHDAGRFLDCPSSNEWSIAVFRQPGFMEFRMKLYFRLRKLKPLPAV